MLRAIREDNYTTNEFSEAQTLITTTATVSTTSMMVSVTSIPEYFWPLKSANLECRKLIATSYIIVPTYRIDGNTNESLASNHNMGEKALSLVKDEKSVVFLIIVPHRLVQLCREEAGGFHSRYH
jgi:hypothetical protein